MVAIKLPIFSGMVPAIDEHLLADSNGSFVQDAWLYSGALVGLPAQSPVHTLLDPNAAVAFRVPKNVSDPTYIYDSLWMEFQNADTDFISAPTAADEYRRFYWTSTSQQPVYNTYARMLAGQPPWLLGIPQPGNISVIASGGVGATVSRAYVTTLVTAYGEEGPASAPFLINGKVDDTFAVTIAAVDAADMGGVRNIDRIRLYRTIVSAQGTATYYLVAELAASAVAQVYNDTMLDLVLASKPILESTAWTAPPDLDGFVVMPNGIIAGYIGKELYFSEPYRPHAWPAAYSLTLEYEIVGLGVVGQTLVCCTTGNPFTASGVNPAVITTAKVASFNPCLSKGSILQSEEGVYFTSPNGIILVNAGLSQNITQQYITRDKWNTIINRAKVNAGKFGGAYYAFGAGVDALIQEDAFQVDAFQTTESDGATEGFLLDPQNANVGFTYLKDENTIKSVTNDMFSGDVMVVSDGCVRFLDQRPGFKTEPYIWRSKVFQTPKIDNFAAFRLYFKQPTDHVFVGPVNNELDQVYNPLTQLAIIRVWADDVLVLAREIRQNGELQRMPSGFKAQYWTIEIEAVVKVLSFQMATSIKELSVA